MTEVVSVRFKSHGKSYFFAPNGADIHVGDKVVVETAKGLELAECCQGNHAVEDTAVVQPLRPVVRIATEADLRIDEVNKKREKEAFAICEKKIVEHKLEMKLVDVECSFEGNKTTFFFTADGRVDFRDLVKDLASVFRNRIELRQIGVRDEAKMLGGLGICGRPYCCSQFLDDFQPVSTKMAKVQNLSLNPTKISGSCGRLMCCLRYEQEAYEDLVKKVPKQGAFVETVDGYGTVAQTNLLRQKVKVRLDKDTDTLRTYTSQEVAAVPGGRPKDGEIPPSVLKIVPKLVIEEEDDGWKAPVMFATAMDAQTGPKDRRPEDGGKKNNRRHRGSRGGHSQHKDRRPEAAPGKEKPKSPPNAPKSEKPGDSKPKHNNRNYYRRNRKPKPKTGGDGGGQE